MPPDQAANSPEACYRHVSPQLLARARQLWSARGLDLDAAWGEAIRDAPGFLPLALERRPQDSRPVDLLLLFDQAAIWVAACRWPPAAPGDWPPPAGDGAVGRSAAWPAGDPGAARDEIAAVRVLAVTGLPTPAMQIMRSISEDVDMALVVLLRPKVARQFAECRTPQEAGEFWKRHVAGGRHSAPWPSSSTGSGSTSRKTAATRTGARRSRCCWVRPSTPLIRRWRARYRRERLPLFRDAAATGVCIYSLMLGQALRADLAAGAATADPAERALIRVALEGGEIVLDQMRWLTAAEEPARTVS